MSERVSLAHLRHELRTPLNHVIGYAEMLLEDLEGGRPALVPGLRRLHEEARRLLAHLTDLLSPVRVETGVDFGQLATALTPDVVRVTDLAEALRKDADLAGAADVVPDLERIVHAATHLGRLLREGVAPPAAPTVRAAPEPAVAAAVPVEAPPAGTGVILVVDDNESNREMLSRRLLRQGYDVQTAAGGAQALQMLDRQRVDLVLLDVMMPGLDGYAVLERLKAHPELRQIPVLMISALDEMESVVRCIELGAEDYLSKPFDPVLLRARIGACLEKKRLRDQEVRYQRELAEWNRTLEQRVAEQVAQMERLGRLKRFFSPALAEAIVAGGADDPLRTHRREVTVVFLDLRGFTTFAESAEPEDVMSVLREYHAQMGQLIMKHEGTLERFTGDGMMIFFNDPVLVPDPAERAVRMAVAMRDQVTELATGWKRRGYNLGLGIGIAQGYATIGAIGFEGRWDYGAIGHVTNVAARLCGEAKGGQVLLDPRVHTVVDEVVETEALPPLSLKGMARPIVAHNVVRLRV